MSETKSSHKRSPSSTTTTTTRRRRKSSLKSTTSIPAIDLVPSNPAQVYRNLLILEESLRQQYVSVIRTQRKLSLFFFFLSVLTLYSIYAVFIFPSIYTAVNLFDKLTFTASVITTGLFYITGLYSKAFIYCPRFLHNTNKGLRPFNVKLVKLPVSWKESSLRLLYDPAYSTDSGGGLIKIVLSTRVFAPDAIEAWDLYRHDYWVRENTRRIRKKIITSGATGTHATAPAEIKER